MGQQNVYVCKIKKNKPFTPPSEAYFLLYFETKQAFPKTNIYSKIVWKNLKQTVTKIKKIFWFSGKIFRKTFRKRLC